MLDKTKDCPVETEEFAPGTPMRTIIDRLVTRRSILKGGAATLAAGFVGHGLLGWSEDSAAQAPSRASSKYRDPALRLNFESVATTDTDAVTIPPDHNAQVLYALGDPIAADLGPYPNDGSTPFSEFDNRAGDHHDGMYFFGMNDAYEFDPSVSDRGILCINHENITQDLLHENGATADEQGNRTVPDEVRKEQRAHGVSCIEIARDTGSGQFAVVQGSTFNRRITTLTPTTMTGPVAGSPLLRTAFSPDATQGRGTVNNCANGFTAWGTYLTCEENYDLYFRDERGIDEANQNPGVLGFAKFLTGIGVRVPTGLYGWATLAGDDSEENNEFARFNTTPQEGAAEDGSEDFRNEGSQYGYIVEIDPFDPESAPRKRTALGRFAHEGCWPALFEAGQPLAWYMGDDDQLQYIYKFVSDNVLGDEPEGASPLEIGDFFMNSGTLYVARFNTSELANAMTGEWIALTPENTLLQEASAEGGQFHGLFDTLDSILVHARGAAFAVGATPMDRPEWSAVNTQNGEVYLTLTNNSDRKAFDDSDESAVAAGDEGTRDETTEFLADREFGVDAANPRGPNDDGHIIRLKENGNNPAAVGFAWDIFLFGSGATEATNFSGLTPDNEFTDPDGLWFDDVGLLYIETDGGQPSDSNNQMLVAVPDSVGGGGVDAGNSNEILRRLLVGPVDCEITGIDMAADRRALFFNVQHPGDDVTVLETDDARVGSTGVVGSGTWPADSRDATQTGSEGQRPRSATVVVTRADGGAIGTDGRDRGRGRGPGDNNGRGPEGNNDRGNSGRGTGGQ